MEAAVFLPGVGRAAECSITTAHYPSPLRFVWHHILPKACGGKTVSENLVSLCDSCHYAVHALLWDLKQHEGLLTIPSPLRNRRRMAFAFLGYDAAKAAGTLEKITNEGTA